MTKIAVATSPFIRDFEDSFEIGIDIIGDTITHSVYDGINYELINNTKLVIFTGGSDISPSIYGHTNEYSYVDYSRDMTELKILQYALELNKKILGICRGHQLINAYLGGILIQDLRMCLKADHSYYHKLQPENGGGIITSIFSGVNSLHHQGVTKVGNNLLATSSHKGVIESCENKDIITTQFHPEFMTCKEAKNFFAYIKEWANLGE